MKSSKWNQEIQYKPKPKNVSPETVKAFLNQGFPQMEWEQVVYKALMSSSTFCFESKLDDDLKAYCAVQEPNPNEIIVLISLNFGNDIEHQQCIYRREVISDIHEFNNVIVQFQVLVRQFIASIQKLTELVSR